MTKVIVAYESKYGNTKRVAETIIEGIGESEEIETVLRELKEIDVDKILDYDVILIGSAVLASYSFATLYMKQTPRQKRRGKKVGIVRERLN